MEKRAVAVILVLAAAVLASAQEASIRLEVFGVKPGEGIVYVSVFESAECWRRKVPCRTLEIQPLAAVIQASLSLPPGDYAFSLFQDRNSNGNLDTNFIGIPKEPVGISNYDGKGPPGGFEKHKVRIDLPVGIVPGIRLIEIMP